MSGREYKPVSPAVVLRTRKKTRFPSTLKRARVCSTRKARDKEDSFTSSCCPCRPPGWNIARGGLVGNYPRPNSSAGLLGQVLKGGAGFRRPAKTVETQGRRKPSRSARCFADRPQTSPASPKKRPSRKYKRLRAVGENSSRLLDPDKQGRALDDLPWGGARSIDMIADFPRAGSWAASDFLRHAQKSSSRALYSIALKVLRGAIPTRCTSPSPSCATTATTRGPRGASCLHLHRRPCGTRGGTMPVFPALRQKNFKLPRGRRTTPIIMVGPRQPAIAARFRAFVEGARRHRSHRQRAGSSSGDQHSATDLPLRGTSGETLALADGQASRASTSPSLSRPGGEKCTLQPPACSSIVPSLYSWLRKRRGVFLCFCGRLPSRMAQGDVP